MTTDTPQSFLSKFQQEFPNVPIPEPDQVRNLGSKEIESLINSLKDARQQLQVKISRLQALQEATEQQLQEAKSRAKEKFGVDTPEELQKILDSSLAEVEAIFKKAAQIEA